MGARRWTPLGALLLAGCASLQGKVDTEVSGTRMAYAVAGQGPVSVVFEAGLGDGMDSWAPVFDSVAAFSRAFAYDRPGYGRSAQVSGVMHGQRIVDRLRALLGRAQLAPPYVLVGHSIGGQWVELFARMHPEDVAGVVFVDSRHPEFTTRCREGLEKECDIPGLAKLLMPGHMKQELEGEEETAEQIAVAPPFPDVELVVLARGDEGGGESRRWRELWMQMQNRYLELSPHSRLIVSEGSGHYVHKDDPELVVSQVRAVVEAVAEGRSGRGRHR